MPAEILVANLGSMGVSHGSKELRSIIADCSNKNDNRLREAWERGRADHVAGKLLWLEQVLLDLQKRVRGLSRKAEAQAEDPQMQPILDDFVWESIREPMADLQEMLQAADVGNVDPRQSRRKTG